MIKNLYKNKNILITGASSGLGKNMAINYAKNGGKIINLSRDISKMESLNNELKKYNNLDNLFYPVDISNYKQVEIIRMIKFLLKNKGMTISGVKNLLDFNTNNLDDHNNDSLQASYYKSSFKKKSKNILEKIKKIKNYGKKNSS